MMIGKFQIGILRWCAVAIFALVSNLQGARVQLQWVPNNDPLTAGYRIYADGASVIQSVDAGLSDSGAVDDLVEGEMYRFHVTAYSSRGVESVPSESIYYTVPGGDPNANAAPVLNPISQKNIIVGGQLSFTASATDVNAGQILIYSLGAGAPLGAVIQPMTGQFTWTPLPGQGPGNFDITIVVTDDGSPARSASQVVRVSVTETAGAYFTLKVAPFANGFVSVSPLSDAGVAGEQYPVNTRVTVHATPRPGYAFAGWVLNGMTVAANPLSFGMIKDRELTARFRPVANQPVAPSRPLRMTLADGKSMLEVSGELGAWIAEVSTDFVNWTEFKRGLTSQRIPIESSEPFHFYRVRPASGL